MELHLAMRRLQKRHVLLLYNGEGHVLEQPGNQLDLNGRIRDWFAYYLKGKPFTNGEF
jgi:dipeptidyl aminopeptidase/acylaminoacyl peptidase